MAGVLRTGIWLLPLLALMVASRFTMPAPKDQRGHGAGCGALRSAPGLQARGRRAGGLYPCDRAPRCVGLTLRGGGWSGEAAVGRAVESGGARCARAVCSALCAGIVPRESEPLRLRGGGRAGRVEGRREDFPLPPSLRRGRVPKDSGSRSSSLDVPDDEDDSTSLGTSSSSDDRGSEVPKGAAREGGRGARGAPREESIPSEELGVPREEESEVQETSSPSRHVAPAPPAAAKKVPAAPAAAAAATADSAPPSKSDLLKSAAEKLAQTFTKEDGRRGGVPAHGEVVLRFDDALVGRGLSVNFEGTTLTKYQETWVPGAEVGYLKEAAWEDPDHETIPKMHPVPTFCVFGPEGSGGVYVFHLLIETCLSGNMFIGCLEPPFDWKKPDFGYYIKVRGWMVTDGGSVFRTGPDVGGPGFCDDPEQPGEELKNLARACGAEMLTAQLKKDLYPQYPEVTTPGIWCYQAGSVITLTLDRDERTVTFEIDDRPPITLKNVSATARPFINMLYENDTVTLLSPAAADFARHKWRMKQRTPSDPDYWLWDKERWTMKDGGLYYQNGEILQDPTKKNVWFPKIDNKDGQRPVPGLSLLEYNFRRDAIQEEKAAKRRRERERLARRAEEKGEETQDWRKRTEKQQKPQRDDLDDSDVQFGGEGEDSGGLENDPVARFMGRDQAPDSTSD